MNPVVIDTNCLLQIISKKSPYRPIWDAFLTGRYDLCVSNEILDEYQEILGQQITPTIAENLVLLILNKYNVRLIEPHFRMEQELVEFLLDGLLLLNNTLNTLFEGSQSGSLNCFLSKSSIFAGEETEKVYDTDCTYSSQWRGLLPFYSCKEDGVELPNQ